MPCIDQLIRGPDLTRRYDILHLGHDQRNDGEGPRVARGFADHADTQHLGLDLPEPGQYGELPGYRDDAAALYGCLDVFTLPSRREGVSNTVLEAMASGLPVVATAVGGNPEIVVAGETGRLVPPADPDAMAAALAGYVDAPQAAQAHGTAGRRRAEQTFSLDAMVAGYLAVYDALTGPPGP